MNFKNIVLASASPERAQILKGLDNLLIRPADIDETALTGESVKDLVERLAITKAKAFYKLNECVISADTLIEYNDSQIGKPQSREDAKSTIKKLMNQNFNVWTSTCILMNQSKKYVNTTNAILSMKELSPLELENYLNSEIWRGKAGSFSIHDKQCPATIIKGELDVVRGISLTFINDTLSKLNI
jgi:septum formation protein